MGSLMELNLGKESVRLGDELPINISVKSEVGCRGLKVTLLAIAEGKAKCEYVAREEYVGSDEEEDYSNFEEVRRSKVIKFSEVVFKKEYLVKEGNLSPGNYELTIKLPNEGVPPTYEGRSFSIKWFVEAKIDRRFRRDVVVRKSFVVEDGSLKELKSKYLSVKHPLRLELRSLVINDDSLSTEVVIVSGKKIKCKEVKLQLIRREGVKLTDIPGEDYAYDIRCNPYEEVIKEVVIGKYLTVDPSNDFIRRVSIELPRNFIKDFKVFKVGGFSSSLVVNVKLRKKGFFGGTEEVSVELM